MLLRGLPEGAWAIVTSCGAELARALIAHAGLPEPVLVITADDVAQTKPSPMCYLAAAKALGKLPGACLVVEDSRAGVMAGKAAGMTVLAITGTRTQRFDAADRCVPALTELRLEKNEDGTIALR